jgi:DNA modification methylase
MGKSKTKKNPNQTFLPLLTSHTGGRYQVKPQTIYCGDNLQMLLEIPDESVDLIYIDPPFNSNRNYEVFWGDTQEKRAFNDRFGDAKAYLDYMRPRVQEMYRVLKNTGSFYYHCDWHASHYIKIMLDDFFGFNNFQNEIIWCYGSGGASKTHFSRKHDVIFFYTKTENYTFNVDEVREAYSSPHKSMTPKVIGEKSYVKMNPLGRIPFDWWQIPILTNSAKERLGYPTQKPIQLLDRIIKASSNKGDIVLDAFCGCGTTLVSAQKLGRKWIGIDISPTACRVMSQRLWDIFKLDEGKDFTVRDLKKSPDQLRMLPHFEFQNWACIALGGIPNKRKTGDYGIDGKLYPVDFEKRKKVGEGLFGSIDTYYPIQVKQMDKVGRPDIDSFQTAIRRDKRSKGYFVAFDFTDGAIKEIKRLQKDGDVDIVPVTVDQLLHAEGYTSSGKRATA